MWHASAVSLGVFLGFAAEAPAQSLSLEGAVELALLKNERVGIADARVRAAEARVDKARALFFPDVSLRASYTRRAYQTVREFGGERVVIQDHNALASAGTLSLTLFDARSIPAYRVFSLSRDAERMSQAEAKRLLAFDAAEAFIMALSLEQVVGAAERRVEFARDSLSDAKARFEASLVSSNDVTRRELDLRSAHHELIRARSTAEVARLELSHIIGVEASGPLDAPAALLESTSSTIAPAVSAPGGVRDRRMDVVASELRARAAEAEADAVSAGWLPNLELTGEVRATNEEGFSGRNVDGLMSVNLSWLIYDGGERQADRRERDALADTVSLETEATKRRTRLDLEVARAHVSSSRQASQQAALALEFARKNANETAELYRQGLSSALEVGDANVRLFEAEVDFVRGRYDLLLSLLETRSALGMDPLGREWKP